MFKGITWPGFAWGAGLAMLVKVFSSAAQVIASLGSDKHLIAKVLLQFLISQEPFYIQENVLLNLSFGATDFRSGCVCAFSSIIFPEHD